MSIDLDYWANSHGQRDKKGFVDFFDKVKDLNLPIFFTKFHHGILEHLNDKKVDHIYQIDYHSDIVYDPVSKLDFNEGTWANFYRYKRECIFDWRYPSEEECFNQGWGRCEWVGESDGPEDWIPSKMGYKKVLRKEGLKGIKWNDVTYIGVSLSPNWCDEWIYDLL